MLRTASSSNGSDHPTTTKPAKLTNGLNGHSEHSSTSTSTVVVDGHSLSIADVVAVANHNVKAVLSEDCRAKVEASVKFLESKLEGTSVYGESSALRVVISRAQQAIRLPRHR